MSKRGHGWAVGWVVTLLAIAPQPARPQSWNPFSSHADDGRARELEPASFWFPSRKIARPTRVLRFRFWADPDFRGLTPSWKIKTRAWLSQLTRMIEPTLGVQFEAESLRTWDRQASMASMGEALAALAKEDPGADVDFVVGLVGALPAVTNDVHLLGLTGPPRHFVLRAMGNVDDARAVYARLGKSDVSRKEDLYARRVQHKELAIFLHEWGHALGIPHGGCGANIMCPIYGQERSGFPPEVLQRMDEALSRPRPGRDAPVAVRRPDPPAPEAPAVAPVAAQQAAAASWVGRFVDRAREQHRAGDRAGAASTLSEAVDRTRAVAAPGDPIWLTLAQACLELGAPGPGEEALASAGTGPAVDELRARLSAGKPRARKRH
jgi:hypothetical protein